VTETGIATTKRPSGDILEAVIAQGDLAKLTPEQHVAYYKATCESLGLNPLTRPLEYIMLNGRLTLYARKDATDQLRKVRHVSIVNLEREKMDGLYVVIATAELADGRRDSAIGAVSIDGLKGDALANGIMKAETKAKRRVTLSICGLGWTDESEIETIPSAQPVVVDAETGQIVGRTTTMPHIPGGAGAGPDGTDEHEEIAPHWSELETTIRGQPTGRKQGQVWLLKAAEKRSLSTGQVASMIGDLTQYATPEAAVIALDGKITEAVR